MSLIAGGGMSLIADDGVSFGGCCWVLSFAVIEAFVGASAILLPLSQRPSLV